MNSVLSLQALDINFTDENGPLSGVDQCPKTGSSTSYGCSSSSNVCDVAGHGEHYF